MNNQEVLDNAPEGATHVDAEHCYWDLRRCNDYPKVYSEDGIQDFGWFETDESPDVIGLRSLADIRRIAELEKMQKQLLSLIYNSAVSNVALAYSVDIESIASDAYKITGVNAEQLKGGEYNKAWRVIYEINNRYTY